MRIEEEIRFVGRWGIKVSWEGRKVGDRLSQFAQEFPGFSTEGLLSQETRCLSQTGCLVALEQGFSTRGYLPPREHLAGSLDTFGCHNQGRVLLASSESRPAHRTVPPRGLIWPQTSLIARLRSPALEGG